MSKELFSCGARFSGSVNRIMEQGVGGGLIGSLFYTLPSCLKERFMPELQAERSVRFGGTEIAKTCCYLLSSGCAVVDTHSHLHRQEIVEHLLEKVCPFATEESEQFIAAAIFQLVEGGIDERCRTERSPDVKKQIAKSLGRLLIREEEGEINLYNKKFFQYCLRLIAGLEKSKRLPMPEAKDEALAQLKKLGKDVGSLRTLGQEEQELLALAVNKCISLGGGLDHKQILKVKTEDPFQEPVSEDKPSYEVLIGDSREEKEGGQVGTRVFLKRTKYGASWWLEYTPAVLLSGGFRLTRNESYLKHHGLGKIEVVTSKGVVGDEVKSLTWEEIIEIRLKIEDGYTIVVPKEEMVLPAYEADKLKRLMGQIEITRGTVKKANNLYEDTVIRGIGVAGQGISRLEQSLRAVTAKAERALLQGFEGEKVGGVIRMRDGEVPGSLLWLKDPLELEGEQLTRFRAGQERCLPQGIKGVLVYVVNEGGKQRVSTAEFVDFEYLQAVYLIDETGKILKLSEIEGLNLGRLKDIVFLSENKNPFRALEPGEEVDWEEIERVDLVFQTGEVVSLDKQDFYSPDNLVVKVADYLGRAWQKDAVKALSAIGIIALPALISALYSVLTEEQYLPVVSKSLADALAAKGITPNDLKYLRFEHLLLGGSEISGGHKNLLIEITAREVLTFLAQLIATAISFRIITEDAANSISPETEEIGREHGGRFALLAKDRKRIASQEVQKKPVKSKKTKKGGLQAVIQQAAQDVTRIKQESHLKPKPWDPVKEAEAIKISEAVEFSRKLGRGEIVFPNLPELTTKEAEDVDEKEVESENREE
jgi:hypothetical protein